MHAIPTIWGLHHNRGRPLIQEGVAAIGWEDAGDFTDFPDDREQFKDRLRSVYPGKSEAWVANAAGQLRRFRHVISVGDLIIYPRPEDRTINVGRVAGDYVYDADRFNGSYRNQRLVDWIKVGLPRDSFSQGCLYEIGAAMSVFMVKTHGDEFVAAIDGASAAASPSATAESNSAVPASDDAAELAAEDEPTVERIRDFTRDFVLKRFNTDLKGHPFAEFCGQLLEALGYTTQVSPPGADQGIDILATEDPLGVKPPALKVQCKSGSGQTKSEQVQALNGTLTGSDQGLYISLGGFTPPAKQAAAGMPKMRLMDARQLIDLVLNHYTDLPDEAKQAIPLRRVWMPDPPDIES